MKIYDLSTQKEGENRDPRKDFERELKLLKRVQSTYVVGFYGQSSDPDNSRYYLLLEFCNFDLQKLISLQK